MKLLVTGGAGFIGSNFIRMVLSERPDWHVLNYDLLTYAGNLENLKEVEENSNYTFVKGDICDGERLEKLVWDVGFDAVVNFAAESHVDRSILEPATFIRTNVLGTQVLLDVARNSGIEKFLHISTDEVYGSISPPDKFSEKSPIKPNSPYASSKASADLICRAYHKTYDYPVIITRSSNNYGPYQFPEKLIPLMIINAMNNNVLPVYGDGKNVRDWIHVEDNCRGLLAVLEKGQPGVAYNIGGDNEMKNIELVKTLLELLGKPESLISYIEDRPGHDKRYALDCRRAKNSLDWEPKKSFRLGLQDTVSWYIKNKSWCRSINSGAYQKYYMMNYGGR